MVGRTALAAFVAGTAILQVLPALPGTGVWGVALGALTLASTVALRFGPRPWRPWLVVPWALCAGLGWAAWRAEARLADRLDAADENRVARVVLRVAALVQENDAGKRFEADILQAIPAGVPARVQVAWHRPGAFGRGAAGPPLPEVLPGQSWRAALVLKRPRGTRNPHGFDYEGWMFARGVRAVGTVRGRPRLLDDRPWAGPGIALERARHAVREGMRRALGDSRYGPVLIALALGDQAGVRAEDWAVFNRTGITHLVSISGLHVTLVAALGGVGVLAAWKRLSWRGRALAERMPARTAGAAAAMAVAWLYCLLAGWGIPSQRTFFMLAVVASAAALRLPLSGSRLLALAGALVAAFDPWAAMSTGFWLSFGAVGVLMFASAGEALRRPERGARRRRAWRALREAAGLQLAITVALMPPLAFLFQQVSVGSPLANAVAIPVVSFVVTPLALACGLLAVLPGAEAAAHWAGWAGHAAFETLMGPVAYLAQAGWANLNVAAPPWPLLAAGAAGTVLAMQPRGLPWRGAGWLLVLPALCWRPERPAHGEWRLAALDVGQGSAIVVETARRTLLFDTGMRIGRTTDAGERTVWPYLRARGIGRLDTLVVSHADVDHAGGVGGVLRALPVARAYASFDLPARAARDARIAGLPAPPAPGRADRCRAGLAWEADGVRFEFLNPPDGRGRGGNRDSCVLWVRGRRHSALLTGDIPAAGEARLVAAGVRADVVVVSHHGSATASSPAFVRAAHAAHAIAQAGHLNRFGHPAPAVQARWERAGARFWRTDRDGALVVRETAGGLQVSAERTQARRYWQED